MAETTVNLLPVLGAAPATDDDIPIWDTSAAAYKRITTALLLGGTMTGAGVLATGGFTLTVPETGTAVTTAATQTLDEKGLTGVNKLSFNPGPLVISGGVITPAATIIRVKSESGTADDLDTITAPSGWELLILFAYPGDTITIKDSVGNIILPSGDIALSGGQKDNVMLFYHAYSTNWILLSSQVGY